MNESTPTSDSQADLGYPVVLRLLGRPCLVVGGGPVAARRAAGLLAAGALVTVVAPRVDPSIEESARRPMEAAGGRVVVALRPYEAGEAGGYFLVVTATGQPDVDRTVVAEAASAGVLVASADRDDRTTFQLPAVRRRDKVTVAVSTGGTTPAFARWLADRASSVIPEQAGKLVSLLEEARSALRAVGRPTDSINWSALLDEVIPLLEEGRVDEARLQILDRCQPEPPGLPADS